MCVSVVELSRAAAPHWVEQPSSQDVGENERVSFRCRADAVPEPVTSWLIDGLPLDETLF